MIVTPGKQFSTTERHNTTNTNLLGVPSIALETNEVTSDNILSVNGSKVEAGTLDITAFTAATQGRVGGGLKNYVPNPQVELWPNGTSITLQSSGTYASAGDASYYNAGSLTGTITQQAVTAGESDSILREARYWYQVQTTNTNSAQFNHYQIVIPNARMFSGQTISLSMVARVFSGTVPSVGWSVAQNFGTGGSPSSAVYTTGTWAVQPSIGSAKLTATVNVPSVSGKTFGTNKDDSIVIAFAVTSTNPNTYTIGYTNFQLEYASVATTFENSLSRITGDDSAVSTGLCQGRLTLGSGDPAMNSDVASGTTLYFTPFFGNRITLFDGNVWRVVPFTETSISLVGSGNNTVFDVYAYWDGSKLALEKLQWTSQTLRATAASYQDGILCKSGDKTRRLLGTYGTTATGVCSVVRTGSGAAGGNTCQILLDNIYNRIQVTASVVDTNASWNYSTNTWRQFDGGAGTNYNSIQILQAFTSLENVDLTLYASTTVSGSVITYLGIGTSTSSPVSAAGAYIGLGQWAVGGIAQSSLTSVKQTNLGVTTYYPLEKASGATGTFYGNAGSNNQGFVASKFF